MADAHASVVELSRLDREALEALVMAQQEKLLTRNSEIEHLKLIIAKLRRMMFGTKSEKIAREVEQLELKLEELETGEAERPPAAAPTGSTSTPRRKRKRRPLPEHLPRETHTHMPAEEACSACGGGLSKLGEDVSEMLGAIRGHETYSPTRTIAARAATEPAEPNRTSRSVCHVLRGECLPQLLSRR
jgi:hypothetical protein